MASGVWPAGVLTRSRRGAPAELYRAECDALLSGLDRVEVLAAMSPQLPEVLLATFLRAARRRGASVTLRVADLSGRWAFIDDQALADVGAQRLRLIALAGAVPAHLAAHVDHLGVSLWDVDRLIATGCLPVDIFLERVGATGDSGYYSHGDMLGFSASALSVARRVGFEVHRRVQFHHGDDGVPAARADVLVHAQRQGSKLSTQRVPSRAQHEIARHLAALVPNGATLQIGVGGAPAAALERLAGKVDLGLHSGILPGQVQPLIARGVINGRRKSMQSERHVATGLLGGDPAHWGEHVLLQPLTHTHDPARLLDHHNLWAINSAFEVDLGGQVNAEYRAGTRIASGAGQIDFARAAHASPSGASVIALPARSSSGEPRIIERFADPVTIIGNDVDYVVTEYGVAPLHGRTARERSRALAEVAHPDDRPALRAAASV